MQGRFSTVAAFGRDLGLSGEASHLDGRLSFSFSDVHNRDILDGRRVLHRWQLDEARNWRREAGFSFEAPNPGGVSVRVNGGFFDTRRPAAVRNPRLQTAYPTRWVEHRAQDLAVGLGFFGDRLRYEGGYARSRYEGTIDHQEVERRPDRWSIRPSVGRGSARRHRIDADLMAGGPLEVSAFGLSESAGRSFRAGERDGQTLRFGGGDRREFGASFATDTASLAIGQLDRQSSGRAQRKLTAEFGYRAMTLELFQDSFRRGNGQTWQTHETSFGGNLSLGLERLREGDGAGGGRRLLPSSLRLGAERGRIRHLRAPADPSDSKTGLSIGASWSWDNAFTDLSLYRAVTDSPTASTLGADLLDYGVDFSHSVFQDNWDVTGYVSLGGFASQAPGARSRDRWVYGGITASYYAERLPDVSVSVDFDRFTGDYPDYDERFGERSVRFDLSLDFSKYLNDDAAMSLNYHALGSRSHDTEAGASRDFDHAISLTLGLPF